MKTFVIFVVCLVVAQEPLHGLPQDIQEEVNTIIATYKGSMVHLDTEKWRNTMALTDEQKEKLKKHRSECLTETKVDEQLVNKLKTGDYKTENEPLKKYALCMMMKSELMTKDGKFKKDVALAKVPNAADKPMVEKLIDTCLATKGNTPHQTAWNYVKCYHEKDPKHAIFL